MYIFTTFGHTIIVTREIPAVTRLSYGGSACHLRPFGKGDLALAESLIFLLTSLTVCGTILQR